MRTQLCDVFGIDVPIFAFTHYRDVVAAVSKAGGLGILGAVGFSPEQLDIKLKWIDEHIDGKPYGVDTVMPANYAAKAEGVDRGQPVDKKLLEDMIPEAHKAFVEKLLREYHVPPLPESVDMPVDSLLGWTEGGARAQLDIAFQHPVKLIVNAIGPPPTDVIAAAHGRGTGRRTAEAGEIVAAGHLRVHG